MHPIKRALELHNDGWMAGFKDEREGTYWIRKNSNVNPCAIKRVPIEVYRLMLNLQYEREHSSSSSETS